MFQNLPLLRCLDIGRSTPCDIDMRRASIKRNVTSSSLNVFWGTRALKRRSATLNPPSLRSSLRATPLPSLRHRRHYDSPRMPARLVTPAQPVSLALLALLAATVLKFQHNQSVARKETHS